MDFQWLAYAPHLLAGVVASLLLLGLVMFISSRLGWRQWSVAHPPPPLPQKNSYLLRTGAFAWWASYNHCLRVRFAPGGILVRPIFPFVWFHPWLYLPWEELTDESPPGGLFMFGGRRLVFRFSPKLRFVLHLPAAADQFLPPPRRNKPEAPRS